MMKKLIMILSGLLLSVGWIYSQTISVTGTVVDDTGIEVIGASVVVKGTTTGVATDVDGKFSLNVPQNSTLVFTLLGMKKLEVKAAPNMAVVMESDAVLMDEVVVTGLGIRKSTKGIGYSISQVSADDMVKSGESNIIQGLAAKTSGLMVTSSSGTPGASSKIILRGPATFMGDNQPLIVVDGVPMDNSVNYFSAGDDPYNQTLSGVQTANRAIDINPEDIESVSVLKGPAAAAIYGQAAGNGAVIYTTKKGGGQNGLGITYSSSFEITNVGRMPKLQSRYGQGEDGKYKAGSAMSWGEDLVKSGAPIYDNVDNFLTTGHSYVNNLSVTGGDTKSMFRASISATNTDGIVPESAMDRYSARLTGDTKLTKWLTVGGTMNYTNTKSTLVQNGSSGSSIMLSLLRMPVNFDARDYIDEETQDQKSYSSYDNPFFSVKKNPYTEETDRFLGNMYTDITLSNVFSISWKVGVDAYNTIGRQIYDYYSYGASDGEMSLSKYAFRNLYTDFLFKFNKSFGMDNMFTLSGLAGFNYNYRQGQRSYERGRNTSLPGIGFYSFSAYKNHYVSDRNWFMEDKALFADVTLDYKSIAFLSLTGRYEWSSTFGKNADGFFYPKADASYVFSHLLDDESVLSYGKVRVAYANVGISPAYYKDRTYYETPNVADGMTNGFGFPYHGQSGYAISNILAAPNLKPERNIGKELGLELKFLQGRINFDGTYYNQTSKDLLIDQPLAPSSGFAYRFLNIGKIENKGVELGLSGDVISTNKWTWNLAVNWSTNSNKVKKLAPNVDEISVATGFNTPRSYAIVGQSFGVFYGTVFKRDDNGNMIIGANGLPVQGDNYEKIGDPNPDWMMNINNSLSHRGFTFSFLIDIREGGDIWNGTWSTLNARGRTRESMDRERNYIIPGVTADGNPNAKEITATQYFGGGYKGLVGSEMDIEDGSWVRLRAVNLSYKFNMLKLAPRSYIRYIEVGTTLRNMVLFTNYKGGDPETSLTGAGENLSGYDFYNNPGTKSVLFNVRFGF